MTALWWLIPLGFLIGSIPVGLLVAQWHGVDIRQHGSGNIGSTNVGRVLGRKWGLVCFAGDTLKGAFPVLLAGYLFSSLGVFQMPGPTAWGWLAVALSPVLGHVFCPWLNFKGGKGVATSLGAALALYPAFTIPMLGTFLTWIVLVAIWRYVSLGSVVGALMLPVFVLITFMVYDRHQSTAQALGLALPFLIAAALLAILVTWTHGPNLRRLLAGTESKVWQPKQKAADN